MAERFGGSCRRDLLDHIIVLDERHLKKFMNLYVRYYHDDRTHLGLDKRTPASRKALIGAGPNTKIVSVPKLGGLHHRYDLAGSLATTCPGELALAKALSIQAFLSQ